MEERFRTSTSDRIILLLLRESRTVNELAEALGLMGNAVRGNKGERHQNQVVQEDVFGDCHECH